MAAVRTLNSREMAQQLEQWHTEIKGGPILPVYRAWLQAVEGLQLIKPDDAVPPLSREIVVFLSAPSIVRKELKEDGTPYTNGDEFLLTFVPENLSLNHIKKAAEKNGLRISYMDAGMRELAERSNPVAHWELTSKNLWPGTYGKSEEDIAKVIAGCSEQLGMKFEMPNLVGLTLALCCYRLATQILPLQSYKDPKMRVRVEPKMGSRVVERGLSQAVVSIAKVISRFDFQLSANLRSDHIIGSAGSAITSKMGYTQTT